MNEIGRNNMSIKFNKLKIECTSNANAFQSIAANNCIISGKWCYEVTILTNGLFQIGFCQLNTPFTRHAGVGDDKTSYAFDGYRKIAWNGEKKMYGRYWECGDVIGVCIDMDKRTIEFYLNGESLGIAFSNISKGDNVAYFPALSIYTKESCIFNFGQLPFKYEYKNYQSFDTPISKINGIDVIISDMLQMWGKNILPLLETGKLTDYQILLLNTDIFNLVKQYINDLYVFNKAILPFLIELKTGKLSSLPENNNYSFSNFILSILDIIPDPEIQKNTGYQIFESISVEILETAMRMGIYIKSGEQTLQNKLYYYENLMKTFISLLKCDKITNLFLQKDTLEVFRNIFNSNWLHIGEMIEFVLGQEKIYRSNNPPIKLVLKDIKKQILDPKEKFFYKINETISKYSAQLILFLLKDTRKFHEGVILKDKFNDLIKYGYNSGGDEIIFNVMGMHNRINKQEPIFLKNIFMIFSPSKFS